MSSFKVVTKDIPIGDAYSGAFRYRVGDTIPAEVVKKNGWDDYVASPDTKAAEQASTTATKPADSHKA